MGPRSFDAKSHDEASCGNAPTGRGAQHSLNNLFKKKNMIFIILMIFFKIFPETKKSSLAHQISSKTISRQNSSPSHNSYNPLPTTSLSFRRALQQIKRHQLFNLLFSSTSNVWHFIKTLWFLSCVTKVSVFKILFPFSPLFAFQKHNVSYLSHNVNCFFYH